MRPLPPSTRPPEGGFAPILERNISALLTRRQRELEQRSVEDRLAAGIARFAGGMWSIYVHALIFGSWIVINLGWTPLPKFDESLVVLAMVASVEAIFLSTFVLITQNRLAAEADRRADLDLQISLLSEHEITRLIQLVAAIGDKLGISESRDPTLEALKKDVAPEQVLDRIAEADQATSTPSES